MDTNCGCRNTGAVPTANRKMLLVEATPSEAALCDVLSLSGTDQCPKQEPSYDTILSSFVLPTSSSTITATVCNGSIYAVGQWIQFIDPIISMKITAVNANLLTLVNTCPDGNAPYFNPDAGQAMQSGSRFVITLEPDCMTNQEQLGRISDALDAATEICVEALVESNSTSVVQPVGRVESDPNDSSIGRCLRRIYGIFFKAGTPILSALSVVDAGSYSDYRRLGISRTTKEVKQLPNVGELSGVVAGNQYIVGSSTDGDYAVGPSGVPCLFVDSVLDVGSALPVTPTVVAVNASTYTQSIDLTSNSYLAALKRNTNIDYYVMLHLVVRLQYTSGYGRVKVSANSQTLMFLAFNNSSLTNDTGSIVVPILVNHLTNTIDILLEGTIPSVAINATLRGAYV